MRPTHSGPYNRAEWFVLSHSDSRCTRAKVFPNGAIRIQMLVTDGSRGPDSYISKEEVEVLIEALVALKLAG